MKPQTYQMILSILFGTLGSVLIGLIFFGTTIFNPYRSNFMFITLGFYGSLFFSLLEYKNSRDQIFGMIIIFFLSLVVFQGRSITIYIIIRDLTWLSGLFLSVKLYHLFIKRNRKIKFYLRSFAMVFLFGILSSASGLILYIINVGRFPRIDLIYVFGRYGILIGFGIGMAIDFYLQNRKYFFRLLKVKSD